jgi:hypothetical protein
LYKLRKEKKKENALMLFVTCIVASIKSKVVTSEGSTNFFYCNVGVRQNFFAGIFSNDLEDYLCDKNVNEFCRKWYVENLQMYLKTFVLLYADDALIFAESENDLQSAFNTFKSYCDQWKK